MIVPNPLIKPWMIGALNRYGNVGIGEAKINRHGKQAYIEAFASHGFNVRIDESLNEDGYKKMKEGKNDLAFALRPVKMKFYIVSLKGKENKDDQ